MRSATFCTYDSSSALCLAFSGSPGSAECFVGFPDRESM